MSPSLLLFFDHVPLAFFFNDTATTEIYTLSLHDALPIFLTVAFEKQSESDVMWALAPKIPFAPPIVAGAGGYFAPQDRKSTRLNSSHGYISYAVFCLKKKKKNKK